MKGQKPVSGPSGLCLPLFPWTKRTLKMKIKQLDLGLSLNEQETTGEPSAVCEVKEVAAVVREQLEV